MPSKEPYFPHISAPFIRMRWCMCCVILRHELVMCCARCCAMNHTKNMQLVRINTGWRRPIGCLKLQDIFHKRATNYRALLRKMTYKDKASYESLPPCTRWVPRLSLCVYHVYYHVWLYVWQMHIVRISGAAHEYVRVSTYDSCISYISTSVCLLRYVMYVCVHDNRSF